MSLARIESPLHDVEFIRVPIIGEEQGTSEVGDMVGGVWQITLASVTMNIL